MSQWRDIPGYQGAYTVSDKGEVFSYLSRGPIKPKKAKTGYLEVCLYNGRKKKYLLLHRIIASAFIENPENHPEVNHKDGNRANNKVSNLEWCSRDENLKHAYETGLTPFDTSSKGVVCWKDGEPNERLFFSSIYSAARALRISQGNICMVCRGQRPLASGYIFRYAS